MTLNDFLEYVKTRKALDTEEIHRFMDEMSNEARRVTFKLNTSYYAPDEVVFLFQIQSVPDVVKYRVHRH